MPCATAQQGRREQRAGAAHHERQPAHRLAAAKRENLARPRGRTAKTGKPRQRSRASGDWALKSARQGIRTAAGMAVRPSGPRGQNGKPRQRSRADGDWALKSARQKRSEGSRVWPSSARADPAAKTGSPGSAAVLVGTGRRNRRGRVFGRQQVAAVRPSGPRGQNGKPRQRSRADGDWALKSARQSVRAAPGRAAGPCRPALADPVPAAGAGIRK